MIIFNKPYLTGKFLILFLFNVLFFAAFAYILPLRFEENDDVVMCLIASGTYSGLPDAHLVFINYIYGYILTFFYNIFQDLEWYTLFFCAIHIVALSIIGWVVLKNKKSFWLKGLFLLLIYVIEIRIILLFQFTTTAALGSFAGLLLLFEKNRILRISGVFFFLLSSLVRFDAAMLVMLLMLPIFIYEIIRTKNVLKILIPVSCCICCAFLFQVYDNQAYIREDVNEEWSDYKEYNRLRGQLNDNPNAWRIADKLPEGVSPNDYGLLLYFFPDGSVINLMKIKELHNEIQRVSLQEKLNNIYPSLRQYTSVLGLIVLLFICVFLSENQRNKLYLLFYILFYVGVLAYVSMAGSLKYRVFITTMFPVFFFLFNSIEIFSVRNVKNVGYIGLIMFLFLNFSYRTNKIRNIRNGYEKTMVAEQRAIIEEIKQENAIIIPIAADLTIELWNPFEIKREFSKFHLRCLGWMTNIPLNKGTLDSHFSLINADTYLFMSSENEKKVVPLIQEALTEHYDCNTQKVKQIESEHYVLVQLKNK